MELYKGFVCHPAVCAVGNTYQIMLPVKYDMLVRVRVGDEYYYNHTNGIRISATPMQRISVPMKKLDAEKQYTVLCSRLKKRKAYCSEPSEEVEVTYKFKPIEKTENIKIYHIADTHGCVNEAVNACKKYSKDIDLLVFNGDVADSSDRYEDLLVLYQIASQVAEGSVPCVISRGNHDLRGLCAAKLAEYMPAYNGLSYYTFRLGCIWGIIIDCGEDKNDGHKEYGHTVCCHTFRLEETEFIKKVIKAAEYNDDGIKYRLVISHTPFFDRDKPPFDIESEIYTDWCRLLREYIKPDLMLCGHVHKFSINLPGDSTDIYGIPCPAVIGSQMLNKRAKKRGFGGAGLEISSGNVKVTLTTEDEIIKEENIKL